MWYRYKDRYIEQWNSTDIPEKNVHIYSQLIFDKCSKTIIGEKNSLVNKWCWDNQICTLK